MTVAFLQHLHDFGDFFRIPGHHFGLLSGFRSTEYSIWEINQNKYSPARKKTASLAEKSHNRAIIRHRATGRQRMKSAQTD
jgi:hypothetical protein